MTPKTITSIDPQAEDDVRELMGKLVYATASKKTGTILASAARTSDTQSAVFDSNGFKVLMVYLRITVASGTGGLKIILQGREPIGSTDVSIVQNTVNWDTAGTIVASFGLGHGVAAGGAVLYGNTRNIHVAVPVPKSFRIYIAHGDASSYTYSVGYELHP